MDNNNVKDFWEMFGDDSAFEAVDGSFSDNLASTVLNYYGLPTNGSFGGGIDNLDIKQMDALSVIKLSLLDASAKENKLLELIINEEGEAECKAAGEYSGEITDRYHTIQTMSYNEKCSGVMVTGGKPMSYRKQLKWSNIWGEDKYIYDTDQMNNSSCVSDVFNQYVSIVFPDPHMDSSYEDGIDNLYENEIGEGNPYDNIIGYVYYHKVNPDYFNVDTTVNLVQECSIPLLMGEDGDPPSVGKLQRIVIEDKALHESGCWSESNIKIPIEDAVEIKIPERFRFESVRGTKVDGFKGISKVYVIGQEVEKFEVGPKTFEGSVVENPKSDDCNIYASIEDTAMKPFLLEEGKHYVILYPDRDGDSYPEPHVVFANNAVLDNPADFGDETTLYINKMCGYYKENNVDTIENICFLPTGLDSGIIIDQIWVVVDLEMWAIKIHDPYGLAKEIANTLTFLISPMIEVNEPAPVAFNGSLLDMTSSIVDHDPTTAQNLEDTEFEAALEEMSGGGGLTLSLSFLDEDGAEDLSETLYDYMNSGDGQETAHICGPNCNPKIGGYGPNGGIVNSITYSYSDNNSYTISVSEGQKIQQDFAQISGGLVMKADEEMSAKGTIIQDLGNHIHFKVRIDGFGERIAMNSCPEILRVGDKVSCTVHNVPVEG